MTTPGTQGPTCLPIDQTLWLQLGPFCPWSPPDADTWPVTGKEQETVLTSLPFPLSFFSLALPILPIFLVPSPGCRNLVEGPQLELRIGD